MRNSGNFQQQSLMLKAGTNTRSLFGCLMIAGVLFISACTRMPIEHRAETPQPVNTGKMQVVAQSVIGTANRYIDLLCRRTKLPSIYRDWSEWCKQWSGLSG